MADRQSTFMTRNAALAIEKGIFPTKATSV